MGTRSRSKTPTRRGGGKKKREKGRLRKEGSEEQGRRNEQVQRGFRKVPWFVLRGCATQVVGWFALVWGVLLSGCLIVAGGVDTSVAIRLAAFAMIVALVGTLFSPVDRAAPKRFFDKPRRFVLTGAASGMARHLSKALIRKGHFVCVTDIRLQDLRQEFADELQSGQVVALELDVRNVEQWRQVIETCENTWGGIDVLFNIAGVLCPHRIQDSTTSEIELQLDVNVKGVVFGTRQAALSMEKLGIDGHIINFSSMGGIATVSGVTLYAASKFACRGFSLAAAKDLWYPDASRIAVTCFMPDAVQTPMVDLQLNFEEASMAFSGDILTLEQVEECIFEHVLVDRPVECWLSSRSGVARLGDIFTASRLITFVEWLMKLQGRSAQVEIKSNSKNKSAVFWNFGKRVAQVLAGLYAIMILVYILMVDKSFHETAHTVAARNRELIQGRDFIVTGGSSGLGEETAMSLAMNGGRVTIGTRSVERGLAAVERINAMVGERGGGHARFCELDLASLESVDSFVDGCGLEQVSQLSAVILNAGLISPAFGTTKDGLEQTLQVNHLAQQYLTDRILAKKKKKKEQWPIRIVVLSSFMPARHVRLGAKEYGGIENIRRAQDYPFVLPGTYGMAKQAAVRFARHLAKTTDSSVHTYVVHPGLIQSGLGVSRGTSFADLAEQYGSAFFWWFLSHWVRVKSVGEGAATQVYAAVDRETKHHSGLFYADVRAVPYPKDVDNIIGRDRERDAWDANCWRYSQDLIEQAKSGALHEFANQKASGWFTTTSPTTTHATGESSSFTKSLLALAKLIAGHMAFYALFFGTANQLLEQDAVRAHKINPKPTHPKIVSREVYRTLVNSAVVDACYAYWIGQRLAFDDQEPSFMHMALYGFFVVFAWVDIHFYLTHRFLHTVPWLYKNVHYAHHESHNPGAWSSLSFHVIESVIFFSAYLIVLAVKPPSASLWYAFKFGMIAGPLGAHNGLHLVPAHHHYLHHRYKHGNFGGFPSGFWDKLFGTELMNDGKPKPAAQKGYWMAPRLLFLCLVLVQAALAFGLVWLGAAAMILYILLLDGTLVLSPPPEQVADQEKVFVIGLSRTGTTSISAALNHLGLATHHFCGPLVNLDLVNNKQQHRVNRSYADAFVGHTDLAPALVFQQLAQLYPRARFIYTTRPEQEWAKAMVVFCGLEPRKSLFRFHPTPASFYAAAYGKEWHSYTEREWQNTYRAHTRRVQAFFEQRQDLAFCEMDITTLGKQKRHDKLWQTLCDFLHVEKRPEKGTPFPHRYVFRYSGVDQVRNQLVYLCQRTARSIPAMLFLLACVLFVRFWDQGQCDRACRVFNGHGAAPPVLGQTGSWFQPANIHGYRPILTPNMCSCYSESSDDAATSIETWVPRQHPAIATEEQWWFLPDNTQVCGADGNEYTSETKVPNGVAITNCGQCSKCSTVQDTNAMHIRAQNLTKIASLGGIAYLVGGEWLHYLIFTSSIVNFSKPCSKCWFEATRCNIASCGQYCFFQWQNPLSSASTAKQGKSTQLNQCMHCDEIHCSAYYLQACGANRRTSGVITDINRPNKHVCLPARADAQKRMGLLHQN